MAPTSETMKSIGRETLKWDKKWDKDCIGGCLLTSDGGEETDEGEDYAVGGDEGEGVNKIVGKGKVWSVGGDRGKNGVVDGLEIRLKVMEVSG